MKARKISNGNLQNTYINSASVISWKTLFLTSTFSSRKPDTIHVPKRCLKDDLRCLIILLISLRYLLAFLCLGTIRNYYIWRDLYYNWHLYIYKKRKDGKRERERKFNAFISFSSLKGRRRSVRRYTIQEHNDRIVTWHILQHNTTLM